MDPKALQHVLDFCHRCADACERCAAACLAEPDLAALKRCVALDLDCADTCRLTTALLARGSDFAPGIVALCADLCDACGQECGQHHHAHCVECAAACRDCARELRSMAAA